MKLLTGNSNKNLSSKIAKYLKEKLVNSLTTKIVETAIKDRFETWLSNFKDVGEDLLNRTINNYEERKRKKKEKEVSRKTISKKVRLPGKLADCSSDSFENSELFKTQSSFSF